VLHAFAAGFGPVRFLNSVPALRHHFGPSPALDRYAARLRERLPFRCPRCRLERPYRVMTRHLWRKHRRLLDGRRVRSLWRMLDGWLTDPAGGRLHVYRGLLVHGLRADDALDHLRRDAQRHRAGLCPRCFTAVPLDAVRFPVAEDVRPLSLAGGRLSGHGYVVEVQDQGITYRLRAETPQGVIFDGREPGHSLTLQGWRWLGVGLPVGLALVLALLLPPPAVIWGTLIPLLVALGIGLGLRAQPPPDLADRAVDHAWRLLAPQLQTGGSSADEAAALAGLAQVSIGRGSAQARERRVSRLIERLSAAPESPIALAALLRLRAEDAAVTGNDAVRIVADAVGPCLTGEWPASWANLLLADDTLAGWTPGQRARLRVLLAARAFTAGLGVWELHELGRVVPALGRTLGAEDTDGLARLRLLWELRPKRPWQRCGSAATVFELANYPMLGGQHLEAAPDLLLFQPLPGGRDGQPDYLLVCGRGLILRDALLHERPQSFDSRPLPVSKGSGYELDFGPHKLHYADAPDVLARRLEAWCGFYFDRFLPRMADVLIQPAGVRLRPLLRQLTVKCRECGKRFLGRHGPAG
jgi:hypothetical protein